MWQGKKGTKERFPTAAEGRLDLGVRSAASGSWGTGRTSETALDGGGFGPQISYVIEVRARLFSRDRAGHAGRLIRVCFGTSRGPGKVNMNVARR